MLRTYKYRLYPTRKQIASMAMCLEAHRRLYNNALDERKTVYEQTGHGVNYCQQSGRLKGLRERDKDLAACGFSSLQQTLRRVQKTYDSFFRRVKRHETPGFPRFKSKDRFNTMEYPFGDGATIQEKRLRLAGIGCIKVKWHRPMAGTVKRVTVTARNGKYYAAFSVEQVVVPVPKKAGGCTVGIDLGVKTFAVVSDGSFIDNPKFLKASASALLVAQQSLSRKKRGSNRRRKAKIKLARVHEKIANRRLDFAHKTANRLVADYDGLVFEDLDVKQMLVSKAHPGSRNIHKGINDAAWGLMLRLIESYKAEKAGCSVTKVDPRNTSQTCSSCGATVKKALSVRKHSCPSCGLILDRDLNAARNILHRARTEPSDQLLDI